MLLSRIKIKNFRGYKDTIVIPINKMTAFVGKNDIGKSTILEALEIFFNGDTKDTIISCDNEDLNVWTDDDYFEITCTFTDLPEQLTIDSNTNTSLEKEYLLNGDGELEIMKRFIVNGKKPKMDVYFICDHPCDDDLKELLLLKNAGLKTLAAKIGVEKNSYNASINSEIREAIRNSFDTIITADTELTANKEDSKKVYEAIQPYLPIYALFQSDRISSDEDREIMDPMKLAIKQALQEVSLEIEQIKDKVMDEAMDIARRTLDKLNEMSPEIASSLQPEFIAEPKLDTVFKLRIKSDDDIPMNKRGSGIRRLLLLNFFRAEADRKMHDTSHNSVIYAFEEPETSQHPNHQVMLMDSFKELANKANIQVIITTHTPDLAGMVNTEDLRLIKNDGAGKIIKYREENVYQEICDELGLLLEPISESAKAILLVEGPGDVVFINHIAKCLYDAGVMDTTFERENFAILPIGGCGTLKYWRQMNLAEQFHLPWCVLLDSDLGAEENTGNIEKITSLRTQGIKAYATRKREPENYISVDCIREEVNFSDTDDAKKIIADATNISCTNVLSTFWPKMTFDQIRASETYYVEGIEHHEFEEMLKDFFSLLS